MKRKYQAQFTDIEDYDGKRYEDINSLLFERKQEIRAWVNKERNSTLLGFCSCVITNKDLKPAQTQFVLKQKIQCTLKI